MAEIERDGIESVSARRKIVLKNNEIPERKTAIGVLLAERLEDPNVSHSMHESQSSFVFGD